MKKLCKSNSQKMIAGVCGGIAEYFGWDPTIVRLGFAVFSVFAGSGIVLYLLAAVIMPQQENVFLER